MRLFSEKEPLHTSNIKPVITRGLSDKPPMRIVLTDEEEWELAQYYLTFPNATKLPKNKNKNKNKNKCKKEDFYVINHAPRILSHSFIRINNKIYKIRSFLGKGSQGKVKLVENEEGQLFALKISEEKGAEGPFIEKEIEMIKKTGGLIGVLRNRNNKTYQLSPYKGISLGAYLELNPNLSIAQKCDLAIKLAIEISRLHSNKIGHFDIKPGNITIDLEGNIHLIDFGLSEEMQDGIKPLSDMRGTLNYLPAFPYDVSANKLDIIAYLRTCFMPSVILDIDGIESKPESLLAIFDMQNLTNNSSLKQLFDDANTKIDNKYLDGLDFLYLLKKLIAIRFKECKNFDEIDNMLNQINRIDYLSDFYHFLANAGGIDESKRISIQNFLENNLSIPFDNFYSEHKKQEMESFQIIPDFDTSFDKDQIAEVSNKCALLKIPLKDNNLEIACKLKESNISIDQKNIEISKALLFHKLQINKENFIAYLSLEKQNKIITKATIESEILSKNNSNIRKQQNRDNDQGFCFSMNQIATCPIGKGSERLAKAEKKRNQLLKQEDSKRKQQLLREFKATYAQILREDIKEDKNKYLGCFISIFRGWNTSTKAMNLKELLYKASLDYKKWSVTSPKYLNQYNENCLAANATRTLRVFYRLKWINAEGKIALPLPSGVSLEPKPLPKGGGIQNLGYKTDLIFRRSF
ncbi:MAG: hypothetical protein H2069_02155 [Legionella sp.]|nr:hypothetical protein [Legionella sp.]